MKSIVSIFILLAFTSCGQSKNAQNEQKNSSMNTPKESIHQFTVNDIDGKPFDFKSLIGKKIMVVNTASKCGLTPQYEKLEALYQKYKNSNFVIIGFPANNFMGQEPGTNEEIATFCKKNYGVNFPLMEKSIVIKKNHQNEVHKWLSDMTVNGWCHQEPAWNFCKYLVNEQGVLTHYFPMTVDPLSLDIISAIEAK